MNKCYFCLVSATSKEHVPPKCLFPEEKDLSSGESYRKELVTVPSCDIHNLGISRDDEYLLLILALGYFNNTVAKDHFSNKLRRALSRKPALLVKLFGTQRSVTVDFQPTVSVEIDRDRFDTSIEMVFRGLYYHEYSELWKHPVRVFTPLLLFQDDENIDNLVTKLCKKAIKELINIEKKGKNPEVFWYKMLIDREKGELVCRMTFYEGFDVFLLSNSVIQ